MKVPKKSKPKKIFGERRSQAGAIPESAFAEVVHLIESARQRAFQSVNTALIDLYWQVGEYISHRIAEDGWGKGTVTALAAYIEKGHPGLRGFSPQNLWRMRQFFEAYRDMPKLSSLLRELPWSSNLHILTKTKRPEEREFYLRMATRNGWQVREVARQIDGALFERAVLNPPKLSKALRKLHPSAGEVFKDVYMLEFLGLSDTHSEMDLHRSLVRNLGRFIAELGGEFCFVGSDYPLQVGGKDFALDLLFFHRGLKCLVAIELKIDEFKPEYLGKLEFYLEASTAIFASRTNVRQSACFSAPPKTAEVVEYALSRSLSPALVAEYQTRLPDKKLLRAKLHEFYELAESSTSRATGPALAPPTTVNRKPRQGRR